MIFEEILEQINAHLSDTLVKSIDENASPKAIVIDKSSLDELMIFLHKKDNLYFDSLSCLTGLDNGVEANTMEVIYNLYSIPYDHHLMVKVILERTSPILPTVTSIWKTADWQEREAYDMLGIKFLGHPDLRRILMPADWDGYPLRKDHTDQEYYRGIKIDY